MSNDQLITLDYKERVAVVTINRPEKPKAFNLFISIHLLTQAIVVRCLNFSSKGEVKPSVRRELVKGFFANTVDLTRTFSTHSKVLVIALNGPEVGLSAALVAHTDFIYAALHTFILTPFSSLGIVAEGGASRPFAERLGNRITCEELVKTGLVNKVVLAPSGKSDDSAGF